MLRAADQLLLMSASHDADSGLDEENDVWQCGRVVTAQTANDGKLEDSLVPGCQG